MESRPYGYGFVLDVTQESYFELDISRQKAKIEKFVRSLQNAS